jgi:hypothetical protein
MIPSLVKLLEDRYPEVRSTAFKTIDKFAESGELQLGLVKTRLTQM